MSRNGFNEAEGNYGAFHHRGLYSGGTRVKRGLQRQASSHVDGPVENEPKRS